MRDDRIVFVQLRVRPADLDLIDSYRRCRSDLPTRPQAILDIIRDALDGEARAGAREGATA